MKERYTLWKTNYRQRLRSTPTRETADRAKSTSMNLLAVVSNEKSLISVIAFLELKAVWKLRIFSAKPRNFAERMKFMILPLEERLKNRFMGQEFCKTYQGEKGAKQ